MCASTEDKEYKLHIIVTHLQNIDTGFFSRGVITTLFSSIFATRPHTDTVLLLQI